MAWRTDISPHSGPAQGRPHRQKHRRVEARRGRQEVEDHQPCPRSAEDPEAFDMRLVHGRDHDANGDARVAGDPGDGQRRDHVQ